MRIFVTSMDASVSIRYEDTGVQHRSESTPSPKDDEDSLEHSKGSRQRLQRGGIAIGIVKSRSVNGKTEIPDTNKSQISTHNYGSKLIFSNTFNRSNKLSYGLEYFATEQHPDYFIKHIESKPDNVRRMSTAAHDVAHSVSVFLEHKYTMFLGNEATLDLVPGVRYDFYRLTRHIHIPVAVDKHNKVINNFSEVSPAFSAVFKVGSGFRIIGIEAYLPRQIMHIFAVCGELYSILVHFICQQVDSQMLCFRQDSQMVCSPIGNPW